MKKSIALTLAVLFGTFPAFAADQKGTEEKVLIEEVTEVTPAEQPAENRFFRAPLLVQPLHDRNLSDVSPLQL